MPNTKVDGEYRIKSKYIIGPEVKKTGWDQRTKSKVRFVPYKYQGHSTFTSIQLRNVLFPALFIAATIAYFFTLTDVAAYTAFALGFLLAGSYLWSYKMAKSVHGQRILFSEAVQVGDEIEEEFVLTNESSLPVIWAEIKDRSSLPGYTASLVTGVGSRSTRKWKRSGICTLRGIYVLGPWEIHLGDPFGIFFIRHVMQDQQELVVYPPLAVLPVDLIPQANSQGDSRFVRSSVRADSTQAFTTRPFVNGDPLRHIHWTTSARRDDLFVKVFEPDSKSIIWLMPDFDANVHTGKGIDSSEEKMVILAAALANKFLRLRHSVGLISHAEKFQIIPPAAGLSQFWSLLRRLSSLHKTRTVQLSNLFKEASKTFSPGDLLIPITPSLDTRWLDIWREFPQFRDVKLHTILLDSKSEIPSRADATSRLLNENGIKAQSIKIDDIHPIEASYGELRRWEFKILPSGRAIAVQRPRAFSPPVRGEGR